MKLKNLAFILLFLVWASNTIGQVKNELHLGGSGTLGFSFNTLIDIKLTQNRNHLLTPSLGFGMLIPFNDEYICSINLGLNYNYLKYGFGVYLIGFTPMPFMGDGGSADMVLLYPNLNYTILNREQWYFKISAGAYLPFSRIGNHYNKIRVSFEEFAFPGIGLIFGLKSCK